MKRRLATAGWIGLAGGLALGARDVALILGGYRYLLESDTRAWTLGLVAWAVYSALAVPCLLAGSLALSWWARSREAADEPERSVLGLAVAGVLFLVFGAWVKIHWMSVSLVHPVSLLFFTGLSAVVAVAGAAAVR